MSAPVSHGRGGQGNIGPDSTEYADGEIVRQGEQGNQGDGAYSAGRGGAGNIGSPHLKPASKAHDADVVPDLAIRKSQDVDHHVGRGGQGNVELVPKDKPKEGDTPKKKEDRGSLVDRLKTKILGRKS
jgi:hypothetical protein